MPVSNTKRAKVRRYAPMDSPPHRVVSPEHSDVLEQLDAGTPLTAQRPKTSAYPSMSMKPWPLTLNAMTVRSPFSFAFRASSIAHAMLYALSGAGRNPSVWTNMRARSKTCRSSVGYAIVSMRPRWRRSERIGEQPWYRRPSPRTGVISVRWPRVYIFSIGVSSAWSAKSYRYSPWRFGAAALSAAMKRISFPWNASAHNGREEPPKFDPPPRLETIRSGY